MKVLLDNHIAAAFKGRVFVANNCSLASGVSSRIFRAIDEPDDITIFEISKTLDLIRNRDRIPDAFHNLSRQFKAEVNSLGSNVEEDIARGGDGVATTGANLLKGVKLSGTLRSKQLVPGVRAES